jgi:hypothetical protein
MGTEPAALESQMYSKALVGRETSCTSCADIDKYPPISSPHLIVRWPCSTSRSTIALSHLTTTVSRSDEASVVAYKLGTLSTGGKSVKERGAEERERRWRVDNGSPLYGLPAEQRNMRYLELPWRGLKRVLVGEEALSYESSRRTSDTQRNRHGRPLKGRSGYRGGRGESEAIQCRRWDRMSQSRERDGEDVCCLRLAL